MRRARHRAVDLQPPSGPEHNFLVGYANPLPWQPGRQAPHSARPSHRPGSKGDTLISPTEPLQYLEMAEDFYQSFRDLPKRAPSGLPINWPRYFTLLHATELALRAFLLAKGWPNEKLKRRPYQHDLTRLTKAAMSEGLNISPITQSNIDQINEAHNDYWPRYPRTVATGVWIIDGFEPSFVELLTEVTAKIRGGTRLFVKY